MGKDRNIPTTPQAPSGGHTPPSTSGSGSGGGTGSSGQGSSGASGSGGGGGYASYLAAQRKAQAKAAQRWLDQAATIEKQAKAIRFALGHSFDKALRIKLRNSLRSMRQQDEMLMESYGSRLGDLAGAASDNEQATADQTFAAMSNASRERANAVAEAMNSGAGETDVLVAQGMALRSWDANQSEINRAHADTLRSINSSRGDLVADVATGRANIALQTNADREQLWTNYYNQRSEAYTNLGNVLGQAAEYYGYAQEAKASKKAKRGKKTSAEQSGRAFMRAAREAGKSWENPGVPQRIQDWTGAPDFESATSAAPIESALTTVKAADAPEGATLRKWSV